MINAIMKCVYLSTYSAYVNINNRLPIKAYYRICTLRHIRIEINVGNDKVNNKKTTKYNNKTTTNNNKKQNKKQTKKTITKKPRPVALNH
jgi:hypothetical protein